VRYERLISRGGGETEMEPNRGVAVKVGIFFVLGLILLIGFSLRTKGEGLVRGGYLLKAYFRTAHGLEPGASVTLAGVEIGKVRTIDFDTSSGLVRVTMSVHPDYRLARDSRSAIQMKSLLGQYYVNIRYGKVRDSFLQPGDTLLSDDTADVNDLLATVQDVGNEVKGLAGSFDKNQREVTKKLSDVIDENRENIKTATDALAKAAPRMESVFDSFEQVTSSINKGEGTLGKMVKDETLYNRLVEISDRLDKISAEISESKGTLGKLIYSDDLYKTTQDMMKNVNDASIEVKNVMQENREKVTAVVESLNTQVPRLRDVLDSMVEVTEKVNRGEGTFGKLVNDPTLFEDAQKAVNQIEETFKQQEEQTVFQTFIGVILGAAF
jgi:phospholipid/cholesterol/gamma-HCH transport system substrate-binding protein